MLTDFGYSEETHLGKPYDLKLLRRLYPFTRPYRWLLVGSIGLVIFITLLDLALPYVTKIAIDRYIVPRQTAAGTSSSGSTQSKIRYLGLQSDDPAIMAVVRKYPQDFKIEGSRVRIAYDDLGHLNREDLAVLRKGDLTGIGWATLVFLALVLFDFVFNFVQVQIMEYTGQLIMHDLRVRVFDHIQSLSLSFFTRNPVGRLVTRVCNDVQNMYELFTSVISFVFTDLFLLAGIAVMLLGLNWKVALVSFTVIPLVALASMNFSSRAREVFRILRIKIAEINTRFGESIGGIDVIQLYGQEDANYRAFEGLNHENYLAGMQQIHIMAVFLPVVEILGTWALAIVIVYGGSQVIGGGLSLGALVAVMSYLKMFFRPIRDLAEKYNLLQNAMASAERIFLILDTRNDVPDPLPVPAARPERLHRLEELTLDHVSFQYLPGEPVLRNICLTVQAGETVAVVGPTGSGKTSLIGLMMRFYDPTGGRVLINGQDIRKFRASSVRSKMALVMQDPFLFSGTVRDNIFQGRTDLSEEEIQRILWASNCASLVEHLPMGLDTLLSEGGSSLSSGERQLISIARAFAQGPQLILFDEATSYVDSQTETKIQEALSQLMQQRTTLMVAHRLSTVRQADRIIVLHRGQIIETGTHSELLARKGFYYRLHTVQSESIAVLPSA
jgi:ATP-binding cassette subfamily B multidrug efflux pump